MKKNCQQSHIVFISTDPNGEKGGIATATNTFISGLSKSGVTTTSICSHSTELNKLGNSLLFLKALQALMLQTFKSRPLIYLHVGPRGSLIRKTLLAVTAKSLGLKVVTHYHTAEFADYLNNPSANTLLLKTLCHLSNQNLVLSQWWHELFSNHGIKRLAIIPNAINTSSKYQPKENRDSYKLFSIARLVQEKNIHLAIQALTLLPDSYKLDIAGDGPYRNHLEDLTKELHLQDRVKFLGWIDRDRKQECFQRAGSLIVPSNYDAFGLVYIEALAANCPVVVGPNPAILSALSDLEGVHTASEFTPAAIAEAITRIKHPPTDSNSLRISVIKKYNPESICAELASILNQTA